jgi:hypothetical protein
MVYDDTEYDVEDEDEDEEALRDEEYEAGLAMWKRYGLTKEQYDADLEHRANIKALDVFNADPENYLAPEYGKMLEAKIKNFEHEISAKEKAKEDATADVNWYNPDLDEDWVFPEAEEEDSETLEDYAERMREQDMEYAMDNCRDDMRDDY